MVCFPIIFRKWAFFTVARILPADVASLSALVIPVIGVFSSALRLGEPLRAYKIAALGLVVVSLALTSLGRPAGSADHRIPRQNV